jgi:hypothetical protein
VAKRDRTVLEPFGTNFGIGTWPQKNVAHVATGHPVLDSVRPLTYQRNYGFPSTAFNGLYPGDVIAPARVQALACEYDPLVAHGLPNIVYQPLNVMGCHHLQYGFWNDGI